MINTFVYKVRNRLSRYKIVRDPMIKLEEAARSFFFFLRSGYRRKLMERYLKCSNFDDRYQFACQVLGPHQRRSEIERFLQFAAVRQPKTALEIGMAQAGTTFLLKESLEALTMLLGIDIYLHNVYILNTLNKRKCQLQFFQGDSRLDTVKDGVINALGDRKLDLIFIDGDHSYAGVKSDFEKYAPLVANGGMIAFHDICEDYHTRYGKNTGTDTGGVPQFWKEVRQGFEFHEFVDDYDQDGFGIGCLIYRDKATRVDAT